MKLSTIIQDLQGYITALDGQIKRIDADHRKEIEDYKARGVQYGSSVETNYSSKVQPMRLKKQALEEVLKKLQNVVDFDEDLPTTVE